MKGGRTKGNYLDPYNAWSFVPSLTVSEKDGPQDSGLIDRHGRPLVRYRRPVGFDLSNKRDSE